MGWGYKTPLMAIGLFILQKKSYKKIAGLYYQAKSAEALVI